MTPDDALAFVRQHQRAVLVTRRQSGGVQTSPVLVAPGDDGEVWISSRETAYKVRNLRAHSDVSLCVFTERFFGDWIQIDGKASVDSLPDAMDGLIEYYRRVAGEHDDWDDYRRAMESEQRVLVRVRIDAVGPTKAG